jgi:hypothetical protein
VCGRVCAPLPDFSVLDGVCLLLYANKLDLDQDSPLDVNEVPPRLQMRAVHTVHCNRDTCAAYQSVAPTTPAGHLMLCSVAVDR